MISRNKPKREKLVGLPIDEKLLTEKIINTEMMLKFRTMNRNRAIYSLRRAGCVVNYFADENAIEVISDKIKVVCNGSEFKILVDGQDITPHVSSVMISIDHEGVPRIGTSWKTFPIQRIVDKRTGKITRVVQREEADIFEARKVR